MTAKVQDKEKAIDLRKRGWTYNEILKEITVSKSSLSSWLKDLPLTENEKRYLKDRKESIADRGRIKAAAVNHGKRIEREREYVEKAKKEFNELKSNPLFLVGVSLYWAEGAKRTTTFQFMNSDPEMVKTFLVWLEEICGISRNNLKFRLFIHKPYAHENCESKWASFLNVPLRSFQKTIYKPSGKQIKKRPGYIGCLRVEVARSSELLFKMKVWQNMLARQYMRP